MAILDVDIRLGILAFLAENKSGDEPVEVILEFVGVMGTVDDPAVVIGVVVCLRSEFETKILDDIYSGLALGP